MTQEQAQASAAANNEIIEEYIQTIVYYVFEYWNLQFEKQYNIVLIPTVYKNKFIAADNSQALAFARVSRKANILPFTTAATWVTNFDAEVLTDSELNNYLNPK
jgi:hypothetical protein